MVNKKVVIKTPYHPPDSSEEGRLVIILHSYHNGVRHPSTSECLKEMYGLVPWGPQCLRSCTCYSLGWQHCSKGGGGCLLSSPCYLATPAQGHPVLSSRDLRHLLREKFTPKVASPPPTPPNRWESIQTSRQKVAIFARLQRTLW